jgi:hypothetical protein
MEPFRDDNELIAELRKLRPEPTQEFTAELDARAAAGFRRRSSLVRSPFGPLFARLRALPPRRLAFSATATALAAVAVATVVVAAGEPETHRDSIAQVNPGERSTPLPRPASPPSEPSRKLRQLKPSPELKQFSGEVSSSASVGRSTEFSRALRNSNSTFDGSGPYASQARQRDVERSAEMILGADPDEVAGDAAEVFDAVHAANGIVLSSSVSGGGKGDAGARFDLLIPAAKLSDALADFSAIGTVVSRHEATADITAPTVRVGEHLRDSRATIDGLLVQLAGADSAEERAEVEAELRAERRHAAALRSQATKLDRRANLSRVSLRIETGAAATATDENGSWGIGDALGDAGHILAIAAGVTIVGLAIVGPLALIALLVWLANRARLRRARERALA